MLALVDDATVGPAGVDAAGAMVRREALPRFLAQRGAVEGYWMVNRVMGRLLTVTIWNSPADAPAGDGRMADVFGLHPAEVADPHVPVWARVTRVEGLAGTARPDLEAAHRHAVLDQSQSEGFRGSCWLGGEPAGQGLAVSLWDGPHALIRGEHDSKRRRHELTRRFRARVTAVSELECLAVGVPRGGPNPRGDAAL